MSKKQLQGFYVDSEKLPHLVLVAEGINEKLEVI